MESKSSSLFLGLDLSTQQLKVIAIDDKLSIVFEESVIFDKDLPQFHTKDGVCRHKDMLCVTVPTLLWVTAFDLLLRRMKEKGFEFDRVVCLSGTGQQHGSVYWKSGSEKLLKNLDPEKRLSDQLKDCFVVDDSPIWMDSSTTEQCKTLEESVGGAQALANITGSKAYERFTGNQIAKIFQHNPKAYDKCERISLVSSFLASLCYGGYAPIDYSDGSGMNLMNIFTKTWELVCLNACAPNLKERLGELVSSSKHLGKISRYLSQRYGFPKSCDIVAFTGDNPASLAGVCLKKTDICISLGTSDTLMLWLDHPKPTTKGHIFVNPIDESAYMALLCFKNGSLVRETVRNRCCESSWEEFEESLRNSPPGNNGNIGIYFHETEITPFAQGTYRFNNDDVALQFFTKDEEIRALVEGQFLAKRVHAEALGFHITEETRILATGGASKNKAILQVLSDIFHAPVLIIQGTTNSACLGSAYLALYGVCRQSKVGFHDLFYKSDKYEMAVLPNVKTRDIYDKMVKRYKLLEEKVSN